jgi:O-antigen ligase
LSATPAATLEMLMNLTGYLLVFLLVRDLTRHYGDHPWIPVLPLLAIALLEACLGLVQFYNDKPDLIGTFGSRDHFAGLLEICFPFAPLYALAILQRNRSRFDSPAGPALKACGLLAAATATFLAILLSLSRMGFLATLAGMFMMGSVYFGSGQKGFKRWGPCLATGLAVALIFIFLPTDALVARFSVLAKQDLSADTRAQLWRETVGMIRAFPAFGCGLGSYESCFQRYKTVAPMNTVDFAHNDYMQYWAELGIIGFLAGLAFFVRLFVKTLSAATSDQDGETRYRAQACLGALTAIGLHSFVDFNMYIPANAMALSWVVGVAAASMYPPL